MTLRLASNEAENETRAMSQIAIPTGRNLRLTPTPLQGIPAATSTSAGTRDHAANRVGRTARDVPGAHLSHTKPTKRDAARISVREQETRRREQRQEYQQRRSRASRRMSLAAVPGAVAEGLRGFLESQAHRRLVVVLAVIAVTIGALYGPAKDYYVALRQRDDLQTYYARLDASNSALRQSIQYLQSKEGIEDEARRRGYVYEGETAAEIPGLEDNTDNFTGETTVPKVDQPWYIQVLDKLFGYQSTEG